MVVHQHQVMSIFTMCSLFAQGHEAAEAGIPRAANPYSKGDPDVKRAWDEGWMITQKWRAAKPPAIRVSKEFGSEMEFLAFN